MKWFLIALMCLGCAWETDDEMPRRPNYAGKDGWAQSGNLSTFNSDIGVKLQANFPEADSYTLQFGVIPPRVAGVIAPHRPVASITWTVAGNQIERIITVGDGTSITGRGEGALVRVFDDLETGMVGTSGLPYPVTIELTKGVRASLSRPTFQPKLVTPGAGPEALYSSELVLVPAGSATWNVPIGATELFVWARPSLNGAGALQPLDCRWLFPGGSPGSFFAPISNEWVPVPPLATQILVINPAAAVGNAFTNIMWGIEG